MSAFQDFGPLSERRKAERQQKKRKRIMIAGASAFVVLVLVVVGVVAAVNVSRHDSPSKTSTGSASAKELSSTSKSVKMFCSSTDYRHACESSLSRALQKSSGSPEPKDLVKAAISVVVDGVTRAFNHTNVIRSDGDPKVRGAVEDCKELFQYARDDLKSTLDNVASHSVAQLPQKSGDLKSWLSAVMSYTQTCVDGFPEGELKNEMEAKMKDAKQLTSNALAIIAQASSLLSMLDFKGLNLRRRLLLAEEPSGPAAQSRLGSGFPSWMSEGDRRHLKEQAAKKLKPDVVVAKDGSGDYTTISAALDAMPKEYPGRYVIYVKAGTYDEIVTVSKKMVNVTMYGDGSRKTIVTGSKNFVDGTRTFQTATFAAIGDGFVAMAMGFRNTAGAIKHQAVALRVQSDRSIFLNCRMEGYQDTLYAQTHRQFYRSCVIAGTVDFIFGDAAAVFQNCIITVRKPLDNQQNIVTAQGRIDKRETTGFVIQSCRFVPDKKLVPVKQQVRTYLARPWKEYSRTIIMESSIGDLIQPAGYMPWEGDFGLKTLYYGEYNNKGPGAVVAKRVTWPGVKVINREEAETYTAAAFIQGGDWIGATGTPAHLGLYN